MMEFTKKAVQAVRTGVCALLLTGASVNAEALKIGYSDWPGWVAWQIGIDKGWFAEEGVEVEFLSGWTMSRRWTPMSLEMWTR